MAKLLITTNNFWLGGRETYIETYLGDLRSKGISASLIASNVQDSVPGLQHFDQIVACSGESAGRLQEWISRGRDLIERERPQLIWSHHYDLLPAWILSRVCRVPLLVTFHAPLRGAGATRHPLEAAGMAVALHRADYLSGVSPEVLERLSSLRIGADPLLLPNVIAGPSHTPATPSIPPRRFVLLSRRQKLEHLRAAVTAFVTYSSHVNGAHLIVADGDRSYGEESRVSNSIGRVRRALVQLGASWCLSQGAGFIPKLRRVEFVGWTSRGREMIESSDAVMGMGRVVLEAVAAGRPAVVVGYEDAHGLLTKGRFEMFRRTNFSGRGIEPKTPRDVAKELMAMSEHDLTLPTDMLEELLVGRWGSQVARLIENSGVPPDDELARELEALIHAGKEAGELYGVLSRRMTDSELMTSYSVLTE